MKFLLSSFTGLGNQLHKTPLITKIKELYPGSSVDLIGDDRYGALGVLRGDSCLDRIYQVPLNLSRKAKQNTRAWLVQRNHDVFFQPFDSGTPWLLSLIRGIGKARGFVQFPARQLNEGNFLIKFIRLTKLFSPALQWVPALPGRSEVDLNLDLLEAFAGKPIQREYQTWCGIEDDKSVLGRFGLAPGRYICLQPGAANGILSPKLWSPENFYVLSEKLFKALSDYNVILVGDRGDNEHIISQFAWPELTINTAGKTDLKDVTNLLRYAACVVAHDSGILHLANAVHSKVVALYGPTDYTRTLPKSKNVFPLFSKTEAFAAMYNFRYSEQELLAKFPGFSAMAGIAVDDVFGLVNKLIAGQYKK